MFERFTERARQVVVLAQDEARKLKHNYIGTEHLLLGLLREEEGLGARVLESMDVTADRFRREVIAKIGEGEEVTSGQIPFTPRSRQVLELALREALSLGHNYIGTEHILMAISRQDTNTNGPNGLTMKTLGEWGISPEKIRNEVVRMLSGPGARRRKTAPPPQGRRAYDVWVEAYAAELKKLENRTTGTAPVAWDFVPDVEKKAWDAVAATLKPVITHEYRLSSDA